MKKDAQHPYYHSWPAFKNDEIKIKVLTPLRMLIVRKLVFNPVIFFFRFGFIFFILEGALKVTNGLDKTILIWAPHLSYEKTLIYMAIVGVLIPFEIYSRFWLTRKLFGVPLKISYAETGVSIKAGSFKKTFPRDLPLNFAIKPFETQYNPLYSKSKKFQLVIDDNYTVTLAEIFDLQLTDRLVENCNYANLNTRRENHVDIDPKSIARA